MIAGVTNADALPVLERLMQFAGKRHRMLVGNIANLNTPDYRPVDLSVEQFQAALGRAVDDRRAASGNKGGDLPIRDTRQLTFHETGIEVNPRAVHDNLLFHDRNDRDLDRTMQSLVENFMTFRLAAQFMRSRFDLVNTAIRERI